MLLLSLPIVIVTVMATVSFVRYVPSLAYSCSPIKIVDHIFFLQLEIHDTIMLPFPIMIPIHPGDWI